MTGSPQRPSYALSLWFLGIAVLGLAQFYGKAYRNDFQLNAIAWIWLIGSFVLLALSLFLAWRERRKRD
ncbi:hypothetical protein FCE95_12940 [Luteimonas gilva]|uniref:Uncharacterized protein n=1 Tax=Luteimonas gilva TaxID=2572684 RepID=A0A4U5JMR6_9GAMM|nr:hypothetical protein [Luteimonas gilva]TKR30990.1 hypothetical protein FCE95_12940 [Luteimonas gilva]